VSKFAVVESNIIKNAELTINAMLHRTGIGVRRQADFHRYTKLRRDHGEVHLNQVFDPRYVDFGPGDFWLGAENRQRDPIATYCLRRFEIADFFDLIRSLELWFGTRSRRVAAQFIVDCAIAPFGGKVIHGGGLWIRQDYRGASRLAVLLPRLARALAWCDRAFDHDSAMIRDVPGEPAEINQRRATYMGTRVYGFARVHRFVDGWFPPERRNALMHLCHATGAEAIASLSRLPAFGPGRSSDREFRKLPLVDQHDQPVYPSAILRHRQDQPRI
jgi:hypothetical protein